MKSPEIFYSPSSRLKYRAVCVYRNSMRQPLFLDGCGPGVFVRGIHTKRMMATMRLLRTFALWTLCLLLAVSVRSHEADAAASPWQVSGETAVRLVAAPDSVGAGAQDLSFGLEFKLEPGWKIYWRTPGGCGPAAGSRLVRGHQCEGGYVALACAGAVHGSRPPDIGL